METEKKSNILREKSLNEYLILLTLPKIKFL
jgi:hypothetical protein